jgi:hypothetical protein
LIAKIAYKYARAMPTSGGKKINRKISQHFLRKRWAFDKEVAWKDPRGENGYYEPEKTGGFYSK